MPTTAPLQLSESSFQAVFNAHGYAQHWGYDSVGTQHLLLGVLSVMRDDEALRSICEELNLTVAQVAPVALRLDGHGPHLNKEPRSNTRQFQKAIEKAQEEAVRFGDSQVFPRHLLLALMPASEEEYEADLNGAGAILNALGFPLGTTKGVFYGELMDRDTPVDQLVPVFMD